MPYEPCEALLVKVDMVPTIMTICFTLLVEYIQVPAAALI